MKMNNLLIYFSRFRFRWC